jgi:hypothetical protein
VSKREAGRWLVWGDGTPAESGKGIFEALADAIAALPVADPDERSATEHRSADDCGEGDPLAGIESDEELYALVRQHDPEWTPPGVADSRSRVSWLEMLHDATEAEVAAGRSGMRGYLRLPS